MFKLQPNPTFEAQIAIPVPGGGEDKIKFKFKRLGRKALRSLFDELNAKTAEAVSEVDETEILLKVVEGWSGVDAEFNAENLATLCDNYPGAIGAILGNYSSKMVGAQEKN